ncbi:hypothetical protein HJC99_01715 [Candidatus Saccharibacteria bacterium]|nr:hypothetical protein [Candidatus Saccharibacteria bacterium]
MKDINDVDHDDSYHAEIAADTTTGPKRKFRWRLWLVAAIVLLVLVAMAIETANPATLKAINGDQASGSAETSMTFLHVLGYAFIALSALAIVGGALIRVITGIRSQRSKVVRATYGVAVVVVLASGILLVSS